MKEMNIRCKMSDGMRTPEYKTRESAGCDLCAAIDRPVMMLPFDRHFFPTGVRIELPEGYEAQVRGRSGLNKNHGIICPVGTVDSDYRGDIGVILYNLGYEPYTVQPNDRIAQLVISPVVQARFDVVDDLDNTVRGEGGFGSTGK